MTDEYKEKEVNPTITGFNKEVFSEKIINYIETESCPACDIGLPHRKENCLYHQDE